MQRLACDILRAELAGIAEPPSLSTPQVLARYEQQVGALADALNRGLSSGQGEGAAALRELVEAITVYRDETRSTGSRSRSRGA